MGRLTPDDAVRQHLAARSKVDPKIAAELRYLLEQQWKSPRVANARRITRWTMPMRLGSDHGYQDDLLGE
jgi:hypothetical protein